MLLIGSSSAWAATITTDGTARLYFNIKAVSWWTAGTNGNGNFAYFFNNSTGASEWSSHAVQYSGDTYYVVIPTDKETGKGDWAGVILTRNNTSTAPSWDNRWNQTSDITLSSTSNYISKFSEGSASVTWGTAIKPASTASVTANYTSVNIGDEVTLTPSLTSNQTINDIKSTTYTISPSTDASVNDNKFTATAAGTYTVTAEITYNPDGYTSLTSKESATVTITVIDPCTPTATISSAVLNGNVISLGGSMTTCGKELWYGFLWKEKGSNWVADNDHAIVCNANSTQDKTFTQTWSDFTPGKVYELTAYALDASTDPDTWYYDETGIEVATKCYYVGGQKELCGEEWNTTADPMTFVGNGIWSLTFTEKDAREYQFKITDGSDWTTGWNTTDHKKPTGNYLECSEVTTSEGRENIGFTTPTKGNITIYYDESDQKAYVGFEPICLEDIKVEAVASVKDQYNYNETAKLSIADATIDAAYGSVYSISYQWQEKNGDQYTDIQGATAQTYNATNLEVGSHTYRVVVTYSYTGFGETCTGTKYSEDKTIEVICPAPTTELDLSSTNIIRCNGEPTTKGTITIKNYTVYGSNSVFYLGSYKYEYATIAASNGVLGEINHDKTSETYTIKVANVCGNSESSQLTKTIDVNVTDNTPTIEGKVSITSDDNKICSGSTITLSANVNVTNGTITSYTWTPDNVTTTENTYTIESLTETTEYSVSVVVEKNNCLKTFDSEEKFIVTIDNAPTKPAALIAGKTSLIGDETTTLTVDNNVKGVTYILYKDGEETSETGTTFNNITAGTYQVKASIESNEEGCRYSELSDPVTINVCTPASTPSITVGQTPICKGSSTTLTIESYNENYTYKLFFNDVLVEDAVCNAGVFTISEAGSYQITASDNSCVQESDKSLPRTLELKGPSIEQDKETIYPYEVVIFTSNEQVNWYLSINPSTGRELENTDPTYSGKNTAYITKAVALTTTFKGEAANGYQISAAIGDCVTTKTFNVVADPECE